MLATAAAIGVDIGGSAIKFAVVDQAGNVVWPPNAAAERVAYTVETPGIGRLVWQSTGEVEEIAYEPEPTNIQADGKWVVPVEIAQAALLRAFRRLDAAGHRRVEAVGIGATGLIGPDGVVNEGYAFTGYRGFDWGAVAAQAGHAQAVRVLNDARAAAWAEYARTGKRTGAFLHISVGTRVGCALIENGRFLDGADSCAGEFSYLQWISPDGATYPAQARLKDGLLDDPVAFGAALVGVVHVANPNRIVMRGFAHGFVARLQDHLDRYAFKTHWRRLLLADSSEGSGVAETARLAVLHYQENPGSLLYIARQGRRLAGALLVDGQIRNASPDFLGRMIVCAPLAIAEPGDLCFGEIAGSFGIETDYTARTRRIARFDEIAARAGTGELAAIDALERSAKVTAAGIVNTCHIASPSLITVGGAVPLLYPPYLPIVSDYVTARLTDSSTTPAIQPAATGTNAGVIGAALYALSHSP